MGGAKTKMLRHNNDDKLARLHAWHTFGDKIVDMDSEDELLEYIELERKHFKRHYVMKRLHGRFSLLRSRREKKEIAAECGE